MTKNQIKAKNEAIEEFLKKHLAISRFDFTSGIEEVINNPEKYDLISNDKIKYLEEENQKLIDRIKLLNMALTQCEKSLSQFPYLK